MSKIYKSKPHEIEAIEYTNNNLKEVLVFLDYVDIDFEPSSKIEEEKWHSYCECIRKNGIHMKNSQGNIIAHVGDYIIKDLNNEFYPCDPSVFYKKYEEVK